MPYFTHGNEKNKLILLYIADRAKTLLTRDQLYRTAILNSEMEYFSFEQALHELEEDGSLTAVRRPFGDCWGLTDYGRETLSMFGDSVPVSEREQLDRYLTENRALFSQEREITSRIEKGRDGQVELVLLLNEQDHSVFSVRMQVSSEEQAMEMRSRWQQSCETIYNCVYDTLLEQKKR